MWLDATRGRSHRGTQGRLGRSLVLGDSRESVSHFAAAPWPCLGSLFPLFCWLRLCPIGKLVYLSLPASRANFPCLSDYTDLCDQRLGFHLSQHMLVLPGTHQNNPLSQPHGCTCVPPGLPIRQAGPALCLQAALPGMLSAVLGSLLSFSFCSKSIPFVTP